MMSADTEMSIHRLRWQCRRGLLELDLLFDRFLSSCYSELVPGEQAQFRLLLQQPDTTLLSWLQGQETPPTNFRKIITKVLQPIDNKY